MIGKWISGVAVLLAGLSGPPARAQPWLATPGATGTATVQVGHATLKLPPGDWQELKTMEFVPSQAGGTTLRLQVKVLGQTVAGKVAAMIYVRSNESRTSRWRAPADCAERKVLWYENTSEYDGSFDCLLLKYRNMQFLSNDDGFWHDVNMAVAASGGIPRPMVMIDFNQASSSRLDFISVSVYLDPTRAGLPNAATADLIDAEWSKSGMSGARQAYIAQVVAWANAYRKVVRDAF